MILGRCTQFENLTVHQKERKGGRWRKMRNGRSKSFALTTSHHNQSPCYCSHSLSVKSILAVNTPVVLAVCYTAAAIDQCQLDRLRCEHVKGKQSCCAIMENKKDGVSQKNKKRGGKKSDWVVCGAQRWPNRGVCICTLSWNVAGICQILQVYIDETPFVMLRKDWQLFTGRHYVYRPWAWLIEMFPESINPICYLQLHSESQTRLGPEFQSFFLHRKSNKQHFTLIVLSRCNSVVVCVFERGSTPVPLKLVTIMTGIGAHNIHYDPAL